MTLEAEFTASLRNILLMLAGSNKFQLQVNKLIGPFMILDPERLVEIAAEDLAKKAKAYYEEG